MAENKVNNSREIRVKNSLCNSKEESRSLFTCFMAENKVNNSREKNLYNTPKWQLYNNYLSILFRKVRMKKCIN